MDARASSTRVAVADVAARLTTALVPFGAALASLSEATAR